MDFLGRCSVLFFWTILSLQVNIWKIIYLNCGERDEDMIEHRSYTHNLSTLWKLKLEKNCIFPHSWNIWHIIYSLPFFIIYGCITNSQSDQLLVGLIAQLVEHCTVFAEVMGSNPVQAWIFLRLKFHNCLSCVYNCDDQSCLNIIIAKQIS